MHKFRNREKFTVNTREEFLPVSLLTDGILKKLSIWSGGISNLNEGSFVARQGKRPYHIMIIGLSGTGTFLMDDGTSFQLQPGELFFSNAAGQGHTHRPKSKEWNICWFQILEDASWLIKVPSDYSVGKTIYTKEIADCVKSIISDNALENDDYAYMQSLRCQILIQYFKRELKSAQYTGKNIGYLKAFNKLWQMVYADITREWSIKDLCTFMNLSRAHMIRLCKEFYGMTPTAKVHQLKMNYAYSLLRTMGYTVSEVAEMIGYDSLSAFSTAFKKFYGTFPSGLT